MDWQLLTTDLLLDPVDTGDAPAPVEVPSEAALLLADLEADDLEAEFERMLLALSPEDRASVLRTLEEDAEDAEDAEAEQA